MEEIHTVNFVRLAAGLRLNKKKSNMIQDYLVPRTMEKVDRFCHLTIYLQKFIAETAVHVRLLKEV